MKHYSKRGVAESTWTFVVCVGVLLLGLTRVSGSVGSDQAASAVILLLLVAVLVSWLMNWAAAAIGVFASRFWSPRSH